MPSQQSDSMEVLAPAKLNLALHVGACGEDGYHPVDSVVARIDWCDRLVFERTANGLIDLQCDAPQAGPVQDNLVMRAALMLRPLGQGQGARIVLHKHIAVGAGLGGGSSDAAATLMALNGLWRLGLSRAELASIGARLGADVPLFLGPPAARITGRGEIVQPIHIRQFWALLLCPPVHSATAEVYRAFDRQSAVKLDPVDPGPFRDRPASRWDHFLRNDLLRPACLLYPQISTWIDLAAKATGRQVHMTGSGSALFVLADDLQQAQGLLAKLDSGLAQCAKVVQGNAPDLPAIC